MTSSRDNTLGSIQGVTGNNLYAAPDVMRTDTPQTLRRVMEFSRENLRPIERLGGGQFGEVQLCEVTSLAHLLGDDFLLNRVTSGSMLVAVKMLRSDASAQAV